jgi:hypothetical protein
MFFYPEGHDIHERRKQCGISEGIVSFFGSFTEEDDPIQCVCTLQFTHLIKEVEPSKWLSIVIKHPEGLYQPITDAESEADTIANFK